jgi:hypothetical protein
MRPSYTSDAPGPSNIRTPVIDLTTPTPPPESSATNEYPPHMTESKCHHYDNMGHYVSYCKLFRCKHCKKYAPKHYPNDCPRRIYHLPLHPLSGRHGFANLRGYAGVGQAGTGTGPLQGTRSKPVPMQRIWWVFSLSTYTSLVIYLLVSALR